MKPKMPNTVLILGNGVSRLEHMDYVNKFNGPIYGSNWVFKDLIEGSLKRLDKLNGDWDALEKAEEAKRQYGFNYELWAFSPNAYHIPGVIKNASIMPKYDSNSGLRWIVKCLIDKVDKIFLVGFDFGGKDLYTPNHDKFNKSDWIKKFRLVLHDFGHDRIQFVGKDHMTFLLSKEPADTYAKLYMMGDNHIKSDKPSWPNKKSNKVLILGNGVSRLKYKPFVDNWQDEIWGCNQVFREYQNIPRLDRDFCDCKTVPLAYEFREAVKKDWLIFMQTWIPEFKDKTGVFVANGIKGLTSGAMALEQALIENYDKIVLLGFDFGGTDIYAGDQVIGDEFVKHFKWIMAKYNTLAINFIGNTPSWFQHNTQLRQFNYPSIEQKEPPTLQAVSQLTHKQVKNAFTGF